MGFLMYTMCSIFYLFGAYFCLYTGLTGLGFAVTFTLLSFAITVCCTLLVSFLYESLNKVDKPEYGYENDKFYKFLHSKASSIQDAVMLTVIITSYIITNALFFNPIVGIVMFACSILYGIIATKKRTADIITYWNENIVENNVLPIHKQLLYFIVAKYKDIGLFGGFGVFMIDVVEFISKVIVKIVNYISEKSKITFYDSLLKKAKFYEDDKK